MGKTSKWHLLQRGYYSPPLARFIVKKNQGTDGFRKLIVFGGTEYKFSLYCSTAAVAKVGAVIQESSTVKEKLQFPSSWGNRNGSFSKTSPIKGSQGCTHPLEMQHLKKRVFEWSLSLECLLGNCFPSSATQTPGCCSYGSGNQSPSWASSITWCHCLYTDSFTDMQNPRVTGLKCEKAANVRQHVAESGIRHSTPE